MSLRFSIGCLAVLVSQLLTGTPSFEIMKSCRSGKPADPTITMTRIDSMAEFVEKSPQGCTDQYEMSFGGKKYGAITCGDETFLVVADWRIRASESVDVLQNPQVKPGDLVLDGTDWWKVDQNQQSYLCVVSPVAQTGKEAAQFMYYIVERAFCPDCANPQAFFYSFKKNSAVPHL